MIHCSCQDRFATDFDSFYEPLPRELVTNKPPGCIGVSLRADEYERYRFLFERRQSDAVTKGYKTGANTSVQEHHPLTWRASDVKNRGLDQ